MPFGRTPHRHATGAGVDDDSSRPLRMNATRRSPGHRPTITETKAEGRFPSVLLKATSSNATRRALWRGLHPHEDAAVRLAARDAERVEMLEQRNGVLAGGPASILEVGHA